MINKCEIKNNSDYNPRCNNSDFVLSKPKTNFMNKRITDSAASIWNNLPKSAEEKGSCSIGKFRSILTGAET